MDLSALEPSITHSVLIVDDDPTMHFILQEAIGELATIAVAQSGHDALKMAASLVPDLILLDINLPDMSGIEVCRQLRKGRATQNSAVIFITAGDDVELEVEALNSGGIDFLHKPLNIKTCQLRIRNHLIMKAQAKKLSLAQQDMASMVSSLPVHVSNWTADWMCNFSNDHDGAWFGIKSAVTLGKPIEEVLPHKLVVEILRNMSDEVGGKQNYQAESCFTLHGDQRFIQINVSSRFYKNKTEGYLLTLLDITDLKNTERSLRREKERIQVTLNSIGDAVITTDIDGNVTFMNPIAERMTGFTPRMGINQPIESVMPLSDATTGEPLVNPVRIALQEKRTVAMAFNSQMSSYQGETYRVEDSASPIRDEYGVIIGAIIVFHDISESIAMAVKMSHLANHDQLTNLPNRVLLQDRLEQAILLSQRASYYAAVLLIDIDHFKYLNDTLGHSLGDRLIKLVAERLKSLMDKHYTLARSGGDEFVVVCPRIEDIGEIENLALKIKELMRQTFVIKKDTFHLTASLGISIYPDDANTADDLMRKADVAMYRAKQEGRNRHCYFSDHLEEGFHARHHSERMLKEAISGNGIEVHYQPKVELSSGVIVGVEALARIRGRDGQIIPPSEFIPLAEETGLIEALDAAVLLQAATDAADWQQDYPGVTVSVNVTTGEFLASGFIQQLDAVIKSSGLRPQLLELEVTESALMLNVEQAQAAIIELRDRGIHIAIDDFGTGYSSLAYLQKFRVDTLKIDQSFVRSMLSDRNSDSIVRTIISLGKTLKLKLCPEGIETQKELERLTELQCELGQGYLFSKPLPLDEIKENIRQSQCAFSLKTSSANNVPDVKS